MQQQYDEEQQASPSSHRTDGQNSYPGSRSTAHANSRQQAYSAAQARYSTQPQSHSAHQQAHTMQESSQGQYQGHSAQQLSGYQHPHSAGQQQVNSADSQPHVGERQNGGNGTTQQYNASSSAAASAGASKSVNNLSYLHNQSDVHASSSSANASSFLESSRTSCPKHKRVWCQCRRAAADQGGSQGSGSAHAGYDNDMEENMDEAHADRDENAEDQDGDDGAGNQGVDMHVTESTSSSHAGRSAAQDQDSSSGVHATSAAPGVHIHSTVDVPSTVTETASPLESTNMDDASVPRKVTMPTLHRADDTRDDGIMDVDDVPVVVDRGGPVAESSLLQDSATAGKNDGSTMDES
jgi:hypothetical protein